MKKIIAAFLCISLAALSACSAAPAASSSAAAPSSTTPSSAAPSSQGVSSAGSASSGSSGSSSADLSGVLDTKVENGLLSDTITFPASLMKGEDIATIKADAAKDGITDVTQNEDGSVTYKMTKAAHQKMIDETKQETIENINKFKNDSSFPGIKDIKNENDLSKITILMDKSKYDETTEYMLVFDVGTEIYFYRIIEGDNATSQKVEFDFVDQATNKNFKTVAYPDDLNN